MVISPNSNGKRIPFLLLFALYAMAVPAMTVGALHYHAHGEVATAVFYGAQFAFFGLGCLLLICWSRASHEARVRRIRERRNRTGSRSPWGQRRDAEPSPYSDRLATFLSANDNSLDQASAKSHGELPTPSEAHVHGAIRNTPSQMPFWSILDLPQEPYEAKPVWIIRRILLRIREVVAS